MIMVWSALNASLRYHGDLSGIRDKTTDDLQVPPVINWMSQGLVNARRAYDEVDHTVQASRAALDVADAAPIFLGIEAEHLRVNEKAKGEKNWFPDMGSYTGCE